MEMLWMLFAVIVVLYLSYRCSRYIAAKGGAVPMGKGAGGMQLISRLPLAQDKQLVLVQVGERYWLLGLSSAGVQMIAELTAEEVESCQAESSSNQPPSFVELLKKEFIEQKKQDK